MTRPDRVPVDPASPNLLPLPGQGTEPDRCFECTDGWKPLSVMVALPPDGERTSSLTMHHPLRDVMAAMVREALAYERQYSMGGRG